MPWGGMSFSAPTVAVLSLLAIRFLQPPRKKIITTTYLRINTNNKRSSLLRSVTEDVLHFSDKFVSTVQSKTHQRSITKAGVDLHK